MATEFVIEHAFHDKRTFFEVKYFLRKLWFQLGIMLLNGLSVLICLNRIPITQD